MAVTIKKIAEYSGISRGTVDRVLNNRGRVSEETAQRVRQCASELGYEPNLAGKALAATKKAHIIGVLLSSRNNPFFDDIVREIERLAKEYKHYGITTKILQMRGYDVEKQLSLLKELSDVSALIITPISDDRISKKLKKLTKKGTHIITLNMDIDDNLERFYIGPDYYGGGKIAAGLLMLLKPCGAAIGIVNGSDKIFGHSLRVKGFTEELNGKNHEVVEIFESEDDDDIAYDKTRTMLTHHAAIDTIFVVAAGVAGVCRACADTKRDVTLLTFDEVPNTVKLINDGTIAATISQQPKIQGRKAMETVFNRLVRNEVPHGESYIVENQIKIKQNYYQKGVNNG